MQINILVLSYLASAALCVAVAVVAWRRRHMVGARELALLMLAVGWWLLANALEASAIERSAKIAWSVVAYPGIESVPLVYLLFVLAWTRQDGWLTRARVALLLVVPVVSVGMAATNEWHHLLWPTVTLIDAWGVTAVYEHGPWFWFQAAYAYGLIAVGLVALVVAVYRYPVVYAARIRLVIVASLVPIVASVLYVTGLDASVHADLSSIAFAIAGLIGAWAVLRSRLLDIIPVAWSTLVDSLADAVLVLDPERRIAAFNLSATRLLGTGGDAMGQGLDQVLHQFPELVAVCGGTGDQEAEIPMRSGQSGSLGTEGLAMTPQVDRWFNVRVTAIGDGRGCSAGSLVVLRDVSERRQMVETIRTLSFTDELTGLLNRRGFTTLAEQQLRTSVRTRNRLWLLFADLDGLKDINDRFGHEAGDRALCEIARLLRTGSFREADLVARLGGDEFAILATEISRTDEDKIVKRVDDAVRRANEAPGREFALSLSAGVAIFDPERPQTLDELIRKADRRMYQAKHSERTTEKWAESPLHDAPAERT
ncbi:MAG: histidine kinase N-terminal 7TM domain-containing protein [Candidatus Limnocylindrales bacterium]|jgi:diguanylate cyclase (GGDEF)-like protein